MTRARGAAARLLWLACAAAFPALAQILIPTIRPATSIPAQPSTPGAMTDWTASDWRLGEPVNRPAAAAGGFPEVPGGELYYFGTPGLNLTNSTQLAQRDYERRRSTYRDIRTDKIAAHQSPWFTTVWSVEDGKWVKRFRAPVHGSTTSPDPHTPGANDKTRSELRSAISGSVTGQSSDGEFNRADTVEIVGAFRVRQRPVNGNGLTVLQLHPPSTAQWNAAGASGTAPSTFLLLIYRQNYVGRNNWLECNLRLASGSEDSNTGPIITNFQIGDLFAYRMQYGPDDKIRWWYRHNGGSEQYIEFNTDPGQRWSQYAKAGVYHQAKTDESTDASKVVNGLLDPADVVDQAVVDYIDGPRIRLLN